MTKIEVILPDGTRTLINEAKMGAADEFYRKKYGKGITAVESGDEQGQSMPPESASPATDDGGEKDRLAKIGKARSLFEGARQGGSLGFSDELSGAIHAGLSRIRDSVPGLQGIGRDGVDPSFRETAGENYRGARDADRAADADAKKANPKSHLLGEVGGNLATTALGATAIGTAAQGAGRGAQALSKILSAGGSLGKVGKAAVQGAIAGGVQGGASGAGKSEKDSALGVGLDAAGGAGSGAALGGALGALGAKAGPAIVKYFKDKGVKADELRIMTAMGDTGGTMGTKVKLIEDISKMPGGVGEFAAWMRANGYGGLKTTTDILNKSDKGVAQSNDVIGKIINSVDDAGVKVSTNKMAEGLAGRAKELGHLPTEEGAAKAMGELTTKFKDRFPEGMSMREAQDNINALRERVKWAREGRTPDSEQAARAGYRSLRESMDEAAPEALTGPVLDDVKEAAKGLFPKGKTPDGAGELYKAARKARQNTGVLEEASRQSTDKAAKRRFSVLPGFGDVATAGALSPVLGISSAAIAPALKIGRELYKPYSASARATFAEMAKKAGVVLDNDGGVANVGNGAKLLADAVRAGVLRKVNDDSDKR